MKILFLGDIVGRMGRQAVTEWLPGYKRQEKIDWVIANGENLAGGSGLNKKTVAEVQAAGVDIITSGNHVWRLPEGVMLLDKKDARILRPANYPAGNPGRGWDVFTNALGQQIVVINLIGRVHMREPYDCPFQTVDHILNAELPAAAIQAKNLDGILVDFHAETTSEKYALGYHLAGRVTAVVGTHTHVPTADEKILEGGTAYLSDLGMVGAADSILGVDRNIIIKQFLTARPQKFVWKTSGPKFLSGALVTTKKGSNKALSIKRVFANFE
jgi:2',3'-cyclic-nucleotide 2'-phosphodiesterase